MEQKNSHDISNFIIYIHYISVFIWGVMKNNATRIDGDNNV
jgi:hypothetical protein